MTKDVSVPREGRTFRDTNPADAAQGGRAKQREPRSQASQPGARRNGHTSSVGEAAVTGKGPASPADQWRRHYLINACPECWVGDTADQDHFCPKGLALRRAALREYKTWIGNRKAAGARWWNEK